MTDAGTPPTPQSETPRSVPVRADPGRLVRASATVAVGTALSRVTGFARVAAIAYALGVSTLAGTYAYANETPNIVYELLLGGILTATLVPLFVQQFERHNEAATSAMVTVSVVALVVITALGVLLAPWIVDLYTIRVHGPTRAEQQELATTLLRCFMPQMLFYGLTALATALLNARRRFAAAAFAPVLNNLVVIAIFIALPRLASGPLTFDRVRKDAGLVLLLGLGTTAGIAAMALALWPALRRAGIRLRFRFSPRDAAVRMMLRLSGWTVGYVIANQVAVWVVLVLANSRSGGAFAYLSAYAFFQLPHGLFAVSVMTTVAPELASTASRHDLPAFRHRFSSGLRLVLVVVLPAAALYVGLARPFVGALLQHGAFTAHDASLVADTLVAFAVGLPAFSAYLFTLRGFYALRDTRTPFLLNCVENAINIALAFPLFAWLGIPGLALAYSIAYMAAAVITLGVLSRRVGGLAGRRIGSTAARVLAVSAVVTAAAWGLSRAIGWSGTGRALASSAVGVIGATVVTLGGLAALRVDELRTLRELLPARLRRSRESGDGNGDVGPLRPISPRRTPGDMRDGVE